jgi:hypothetical protein
MLNLPISRVISCVCILSVLVHLVPIQVFAEDLFSLWKMNQPAKFSAELLPKQQNRTKEAIPFLFLFKHLLELNKKGKSELIGKKTGLHPNAFGILRSKAAHCDNAIRFIDNRADNIIKDFERRMGTNRLPRGTRLPAPPPELLALQQEKDNVLLQCRDELRFEIGEGEFGKLMSHINRMNSRITDNSTMLMREDPLPEPEDPPNPNPTPTPEEPPPPPTPTPTPPPGDSPSPNVYTYSAIDFDPNTNTANGYSSTQMDYSASLYYRPRVSARITDDGGNNLASGENTGTGTSAEVFLEVPDQTEACEDFIIETIFSLVFIYILIIEEPEPPLYFDPYYFSNYTEVPLYSDGYGIFDPWWGFSEVRTISAAVIVIAVATQIVRSIACVAPDIQSVEFEPINSPLDYNPGNGNPNTNVGLRIFPDKTFPTDPINRAKVRVRATVFPGVMDSLDIKFSPTSLNNIRFNKHP